MMKKFFTVTTITTALIGASALVHAAPIDINSSNYFVRPALRIAVDKEIIDGIEINGATEKTLTQGVVGKSRSTVSLNDGTVKMYAEAFAGHQNLQTAGVFGERITIRGGAGTTWTPSFSVDGTMETFGGGPLNNAVEPPAWLVNVGLAVFRPGIASPDNFNTFATDDDPTNDPVLYEFDFIREELNYIDEFDQIDIDLGVAGDINLLSNNEVFDIFVFTNIVVNTETGDGLESYTADFENTATYSQELAPGVEIYSSSGQFLGLETPPQITDPNPVPSPATLPLFGLGIGLLAWFRRK